MQFLARKLLYSFVYCFYPNGLIEEKALFTWIMTWHIRGDKPMAELMMTLLTDAYIRHLTLMKDDMSMALVQDCSTPSALEMEILQSYTKPLIYRETHTYWIFCAKFDNRTQASFVFSMLFSNHVFTFEDFGARDRYLRQG